MVMPIVSIPETNRCLGSAFGETEITGRIFRDRSDCVDCTILIGEENFPAMIYGPGTIDFNSITRYNGVSCHLLETNFRASDLRHVTSNKDMCWSRHTFEHGLLQMKKTQHSRKEFERLTEEIRINFQECRGRVGDLLLYNRWLQISEEVVARGIISHNKVVNIREILELQAPTSFPRTIMKERVNVCICVYAFSFV